LNEQEYITVGEICGPFGVHGAVKVLPHTDFPERFRQTERLYVSYRGTLVEQQVLQADVQPGRVLLTLSGITTPETARRYRGALLQLPVAEAWPLPAGSYYQFQIIGLQVVTEEGRAVGQVTEVLRTGSNDVYQVADSSGKHYLIPALKQVVREIDLPGRRIVIRPLAGMLE
jgi:16S rRNA processing protein RimM